MGEFIHKVPNVYSDRNHKGAVAPLYIGPYIRVSMGICLHERVVKICDRPREKVG